VNPLNHLNLLNLLNLMMNPVHPVPPGHYAQKQLHSRSGLVRWSHGSRFRLARELVAPFARRRLLDYGCGDGTFLSLVQDLFPEAVGVDAAADQIADCALRFAGVPGMAFLSTAELDGPRHGNRFDVVTCLEVLEHCPDDVQVTVLERIRGLLSPGGVVIISVPIEIGPPLVAKQAARALVAFGGLSEYATRERYRPGEFVRMLCAKAQTAIPRAEYGDGAGTRFTGHKGFNWRRLQGVIEQRFVVERRLFSPMPRLGAWLNSQVWFVCRRPSTA
jgi:2-polyprenyl-3-methyl-5-hydroxy-6-metoxy-1,4-benzoquinol methylase